LAANNSLHKNICIAILTSRIFVRSTSKGPPELAIKMPLFLILWPCEACQIWNRYEGYVQNDLDEWLRKRCMNTNHWIVRLPTKLPTTGEVSRAACHNNDALFPNSRQCIWTLLSKAITTTAAVAMCEANQGTVYCHHS